MTCYQEELSNFARLDLPWDSLSGCNILVTGATGLIGACLVKALMLNERKDYSVYGMGRNAKRAAGLFQDFASDASFHFIQHDVTSPLVSDIDFHFIIHAASNASPNFFSRHPVEVIKSNMNGVDNLLSYGLRHGMKRFLFVSSGEVYGLHACVSTGEYPLQFCNAELVCIRLKHGLPAIQAHHSYALYVRVILKTHHGVNDDWTIVHVHKLFWDILPHTVAGTSGND